MSAPRWNVSTMKDNRLHTTHNRISEQTKIKAAWSWNYEQEKRRQIIQKWYFDFLADDVTTKMSHRGRDRSYFGRCNEHRSYSDYRSRSRERSLIISQGRFSGTTSFRHRVVNKAAVVKELLSDKLGILSLEESWLCFFTTSEVILKHGLKPSLSPGTRVGVNATLIDNDKKIKV